jgi:hypothetical protein
VNSIHVYKQNCALLGFSLLDIQLFVKGVLATFLETDVSGYLFISNEVITC